MRKLFSFLAATLFATSMFAATAVMQYSAGTTSNMVGDDTNNAATVGLDASIFTVLADKGGNSNFPGLNKAGDIRLYADKDNGNGNIITVSITGGTINSIALDIKQTATFVVKAGETAVTEASGAYAIGGTTFSIQNTTTGATTQLQLNKITIDYSLSGSVVAKPEIAGDEYFLNETTVTLTADNGCEIYYTDDNSEPMILDGNPSGTTQIYTNPIKVSATTTIKAFALNLSTEVQSSVAEKTFTKVEQYDVAEAIAAGLTKDDVIVLRGVVTNMAAKGSNFASYGSLKIYVADATGAAGEFQLFNCMSLENAKFTTTTPAYDAASNQWADFTSVTDANGNKLNVGDTVFAFGKYELYNEAYELQQGCYLLDIIPGEGVPAQTIDITVNEGVVVFNSGLLAENTYFWQVQAQNDNYYVSLAYVGTTDAVAGTYTENDLYASYCVIYDADDNEITMASANITVTVNADESIDVVGTFVGSDGNIYNLNLHYAEPKAETTVTVNINNAAIEEDEGLIGVVGEDATGLWVQIYFESESVEGTYTEEDLDSYTSIWYDDDNYTLVYTAEFEVTANDDGSYTLVGDFLCYDNTLYKITMTVPSETPETAINNVEATQKLVKAIENGQLMINVNGVKYNVNGAIVK